MKPTPTVSLSQSSPFMMPRMFQLQPSLDSQPSSQQGLLEFKQAGVGLDSPGTSLHQGFSRASLRYSRCPCPQNILGTDDLISSSAHGGPECKLQILHSRAEG